MLEQPFSREWLSDFSSLLQFIQTNRLTIQVLETIRKEKERAHISLITRSFLHVIKRLERNTALRPCCIIGP